MAFAVTLPVVTHVCSELLTLAQVQSVPHLLWESMAYGMKLPAMEYCVALQPSRLTPQPLDIKQHESKTKNVQSNYGPAPWHIFPTAGWPPTGCWRPKLTYSKSIQTNDSTCALAPYPQGCGLRGSGGHPSAQPGAGGAGAAGQLGAHPHGHPVARNVARGARLLRLFGLVFGLFSEQPVCPVVSW